MKRTPEGGNAALALNAKTKKGFVLRSLISRFRRASRRFTNGF